MPYEINPNAYISGLRDEIETAKKSGDKTRAAAAQTELDRVLKLATPTHTSEDV